MQRERETEDLVQREREMLSALLKFRGKGYIPHQDQLWQRAQFPLWPSK